MDSENNIRDDDLRYLTKKAYNDKYYAKVRAKRLEMSLLDPLPKLTYMQKAVGKFKKEDDNYITKLIELIGIDLIKITLDGME